MRCAYPRPRCFVHPRSLAIVAAREHFSAFQARISLQIRLFRRTHVEIDLSCARQDNSKSGGTHARRPISGRCHQSRTEKATGASSSRPCGAGTSTAEQEHFPIRTPQVKNHVYAFLYDQHKQLLPLGRASRQGQPANAGPRAGRGPRSASRVCWHWFWLVSSNTPLHRSDIGRFGAGRSLPVSGHGSRSRTSPCEASPTLHCGNARHGNLATSPQPCAVHRRCTQSPAPLASATCARSSLP